MILPLLFVPILGVLVFFVLMSLKIEGISGLIHVIERIANILSFARLMAIGLVGAYMAQAANMLPKSFEPAFGPVGAMIIGGFIMIFIHIINLLILLLSPSVHALRLNVYEFFAQFHQTEGAMDYNPYKEEIYIGV